MDHTKQSSEAAVTVFAVINCSW